jgi:hypothetical protein
VDRTYGQWRTEWMKVVVSKRGENGGGREGRVAVAVDRGNDTLLTLIE